LELEGLFDLQSAVDMNFEVSFGPRGFI